VDFATLPIRDIMARGMAEASAMVEAMAGDEVCEEDSALATARVAATAGAMAGGIFTLHGVPRTPRRMGVMR
jgi:hypothetical protein